MPTSVILDVDTGVDDAMAVMVAALHPEIDLRAISCVSGNSSLENVMANTCKILDVVEAPRVPVAAGAVRPLLETPRDASYIHGADGMGELDLPPSSREIRPEHAVEMLRQVLTESAEKVTVVALAPMTNLALLLRMYPQVTEKIERIVFMGGSASVGNASAIAEFNVWHDPEAAAIVLDSGVPLTMYGLDVFNRVAVAEPTIQALAADGRTISRVLGGLLGFRMQDFGGDEGPSSLIGDAGALCAVVAQDLLDIHTFPVRVATDGLTRGQTVVDRRRHVGEDVVHGLATAWPQVAVVLGADTSAVVDLFLDTLGRREAGVK